MDNGAKEAVSDILVVLDLEDSADLPLGWVSYRQKLR
jgi:hypothetical protein